MSLRGSPSDGEAWIPAVIASWVRWTPNIIATPQVAAPVSSGQMQGETNTDSFDKLRTGPRPDCAALAMTFVGNDKVLVGGSDSSSNGDAYRV